MRNFQQGQLQDIKSNFLVEWTVKDANGQTVSEVRPLGESALALAAPNQPGALPVEAALKDRGQVLARARFATTRSRWRPTRPRRPRRRVHPDPVAQPHARIRAGDGEEQRQRALRPVHGLRAGSASWPRARPTGSPARTTTAPGGSLTLNGKPCWVSADLVDVTGNAEAVAVVEVAPPPTAAPVAAAPAAAAPRRCRRRPRPTPPRRARSAMASRSTRGATAPSAIALTKAMGFNWIKFQLPWKDFEGSPGAQSFPDDVVNQITGAGLKVLLSIVKAPNWARPGNSDFSVEGPPADPQTYADYVGRAGSPLQGPGRRRSRSGTSRTCGTSGATSRWTRVATSTCCARRIRPSRPQTRASWSFRARSRPPA